MRVAVIDCGTNTVRLLVADAVGQELVDVTRQLRFTRLGQGVDAAGRFSAEGLERTFATVADYAAILEDLRVDKVRFVATSAARDASNREEFFAGVRSRLGIDPEVITGAEEAELSFLGALAGGSLEAAPAGDVLVMDIGGGSTELIRGTRAGQVAAAVSLDMGSVRLRERFETADPPHPWQVSAARQFIDGLLDAAPVRFDGLAVWIGVAGTATSLAAMHQRLAAYDRDLVHNSVIEASSLIALAHRLRQLTVAAIRQAYPSLPAQRAEVIGPGALICAEVARRVGQPMLVRDTDILDGAALRLVRS
jgi:exopolyphosphatase/guanosine-5'-triphosphate,3'-diphosphate pyrophosphatase